MKVLIKKTNKVEEVKDSYALNYLVPQGLAVIVTGSLEKNLKEIDEKNEEKRRIENEKNKKIIESIDGKKFVVKRKVNDKDELYASIGDKEVAKIIGIKKGLKVSGIKNIKKVGTYQVGINLAGKKAEITIEIKSEK